MKVFTFIKYIWDKSISNFFRRLPVNKDTYYRSLAPSAEADSDESYQRAIMSALDNPDVKNIAITGGYGSGKSSVIKTFFSKNPDWNPVFISLATFGTQKSQAVAEDLQFIEKSILQQLFYTVPQGDIPLSRFKRITEPDGYSIFKYIVFISIFLFSIWCHVNGGNPNLSIPYDQKKLIFPMHPAYSFLNLLILLSYPIVLLVGLIKQGLNLSELKMNIHDTEIAISSKKASVLNDHIEEILYFFQKKKVNTVVIEDLDRFESTEIFTRLRELNLLLNSNSEIQGPVRFIYAVRDELFTDKNRTKFFDFIVPIIPIVNPTNAYDLIKADYIHIKGINEVFLRQVSLYFDDLRLVKNIFNEFQLYLQKQKSLSLDPNKLLALIIYKNYFPEDFSKLHCNQGEIYSVFNSWKQDQIKDLTKTLNDSLNHLLDAKEKSLSEMERSTDVINKLYAGEIAKRAIKSSPGNLLSIKVSGNSHNFVELLDGSIISSLCEAKNFSLVHPNNSWNDILKLNFSDIEEAVDPKVSYLDRIHSVKLKTEDQKKKLDIEIARIKESIGEISRSTVKILLSEHPTFLLSEKLSVLLRFLIKGGYLDEGYAEYISLFIPSLISLTEKNFILTVNARNNPDFNINLTKIEPMLDHYLSVEDFSFQSILNYSLMDFLLENNSHANYRNELFSQLADESEISVGFVKGYIERDMNVAGFTTLLPNYWPGFLHYFLNNGEDLVIENSLRHIFRGSVKYEQKQVETLKEYLSSKIDPILFLKRAFLNDDDRIVDFVSDVNPKFEKLDCPENGLNLLNSICQAGHFQINPENIIFIINENRLGVQPLSSLGESPFSLIISQNIEYLSNHLLADADVAIATLADSAPLIEPENMITDLLNRCSNVNLKIKLLSQWSSKISNIKNIDDQTFWREVFALDKVVPYWQNIVLFVESENMDMDTLISYLNKKENHEQLSFFSSPNKDVLPEQWGKFWEFFIACNLLNDGAYHQLLGFCELSWEFVSLSELSIGKVGSLIERKSLLFNAEMVGEFRENHASLLTQYYQSVVKFIIHAQDQEFDIITKVELENLVLSNIEHEDKKKILIRLDVSAIEESDILEGEVLSLLSELQVSNEVFDSLLESRINIHDKKTIFLKQLEYFSIERISAILDRIQGGFEFLFKSMRVKSITYSEENFAIANALFERGFCLRPDIIPSKSNNGKSKINIKPLTKV